MLNTGPTVHAGLQSICRDWQVAVSILPEDRFLNRLVPCRGGSVAVYPMLAHRRFNPRCPL